MPSWVATRQRPMFTLLVKHCCYKDPASNAIVEASIRKLVNLIFGSIKSGQPFHAKILLQGLKIQEEL